jgi:hypothetical protein
MRRATCGFLSGTLAVWRKAWTKTGSTWTSEFSEGGRRNLAARDRAGSARWHRQGNSRWQYRAQAAHHTAHPPHVGAGSEGASLRRRGSFVGRRTRLAARRTLPPTDQDDNPDDHGSDADLNSTVPVERAEHWGQYTRPASGAPMPVLCSRWCSRGCGPPHTSAAAASRGVKPRGRRPRGIAMRKLMCRMVGISCAGIALVVLEAGWLAGVCHRRARARERPTWV